MDMNKRIKSVTVECSALVITVDLQNGVGDHLILFEGDKIRVDPRPNTRTFKGMHRVMDKWGMTIGHITPRDIRSITGKSIRRIMEEQYGLAEEQSIR